MSAKYLVLDIGNTNLDLVVFNENYKFLKSIKVSIKSLNLLYFKSIIKKMKVSDNTEIIIGSVSKRNYKKVSYFLSKLSNKITVLNHNNFPKSLVVSDIDFNIVGLDILGATLVLKFVNIDTNFILMAGTANVILKLENKSLTGALILPGYNQNYAQLKQKTKLSFNLPNNPLIHCFGQNTQEAIDCGFAYFNSNIIEKLSQNYNLKNKIIITGGNATKYINQKADKISNLVAFGYLKAYLG
ncbi:type III pantothenate kinase [Mycoplasma corogypsi]|uniref:type III pantothenate kinase n=1 Tax=Mycoplasma corogypsi TaxID=2106 RepID=UPI003873B331